MAVKVTHHCTHGDKTYEAGEVVTAKKVGEALVAGGVAVEVVKKAEEKPEEQSEE